MRPARPEGDTRRHPSRWRPAVIAVGFGAVAGVIAAVTLVVMRWIQNLVWGVSDARWYVPVAILVGGTLVALLRRVSEEADLDREVALAADPVHLHRRRIAFLAVSAIVAAALSGLYGSPPGGAVYEEDDLSPSKALVLVAAVTGLIGFVLTLELLGGADVSALDLPAYAAAHDEVDLLRVVPAALAAFAAAAYVIARPTLAHLVRRCGPTTMQTLVATAVFALLATAWPILRFSGHTEFPELVSLAGEAAWWSLLGVGLLKLLACATCLAGGWRGGEFFPLMFSGAAVGTAAVAFVPGLEVTGALVAGLGAATTVGLRKPVAALLIGVFVVHGTALGPLVVGVAVGVLVLRFLPTAPPEQGDAAGTARPPTTVPPA